MQQIYRLLSIVIFCSIVLLPFGTAYAIVNAEKMRSSLIPTPDLSCSKLGTIMGNLKNDLDIRLEKVNQERKDIALKLAKQRQEADEKLANTRKEADLRKTEHFTKLEALAKNEDQKQAVKTFEDVINRALNVRRTAHDANRLTFRAGVDLAVQTRQAEIDKAIATLKSDYQAAVTKAQTTCTTGTAYKQAADQLKVDLTAARDKFKQSKALVSSVGDKVKALQTARKDANKTADDAFKATFDAALKKLISSFGDQQV